MRPSPVPSTGPGRPDAAPPADAPTATRLGSAEVGALRAHYPILQARTYVNSCSLGALSTRAEAYLDEFRHRWHTMGASAWYEHWMGRLHLLRERAGRLHGVGADETALLPSVSAALSVVSEATEVKEAVAGGRTRVICTELDFPTLAYQWRVKPEIELVVLPSDDGVAIDLERFADAVDERTLFVATSHVFFSTGHVQDIGALADIAHGAGAWCLIDGYQGSGHVPVDLEASGADMYVSGPLKWLCGGPGLAYLFVRSERVGDFSPRITSWFAAADQFAFDIDHFEFRDDARRFELGTPALPTVHTALGGQELLDEVGWPRVFARIRALADRAADGLAAAGFTLRRSVDPGSRSGIVMVQHGDPAAAVRALDEADIVVDHRPGHVRVSPHVYNTEDEVDALVEALAATR
jgi:selenocysteine lyase/cysteine desulfurase